MKKILFSCILFSLITVSCKKDDGEKPLNIFGFTNMEDAEKYLGKNADLFKSVEGSVYVSSIKYHGSEEVDWDIFARYNSDILSPRTNGGDFFVNSIKMGYDKSLETYALIPNNNLPEKELGFLLKDNFGKENEAKLVRNNNTVFNSKFYVPQEIRGLNMEKYEKLPNSSFIKISRKNMTLEWNSDKLNDNGVIVYLSWTGDRTDLPMNEQGKNGQKDVALKFDDNGNALLPSSFFDGLPLNAAFTISIIRGNVEVLEGSDKRKYKFYTNSWYKIPCSVID